MNTKDIVYVMLKLTPESKQMLLDFIDENSSIDHKWPKLYCDHITLAYGQDEIKDMDLDLIGTKYSITLDSVIHDSNNCIAFVPDTPSKELIKRLGCHNENPHVTAATDASVKPVYSNELFRLNAEGDNHIFLDKLPNPFEVDVVFSVFSRS